MFLRRKNKPGALLEEEEEEDDDDDEGIKRDDSESFSASPDGIGAPICFQWDNRSCGVANFFLQTVGSKLSNNSPQKIEKLFKKKPSAGQIISPAAAATINWSFFKLAWLLCQPRTILSGGIIVFK